MADLPGSGPVLGIDWGIRRIGVAVSDETQTVAHPVATLTRRTGRRFPLGQLRPIVEARRPVGIVVGLPVNPDGSEGPHCRDARAAGDLIGRTTGLPVWYIDERMSTARARTTRREVGAANHVGIDQEAAAIILQQFLDRRP